MKWSPHICSVLSQQNLCSSSTAQMLCGECFPERLPELKISCEQKIVFLNLVLCRVVESDGKKMKPDMLTCPREEGAGLGSWGWGDTSLPTFFLTTAHWEALRGPVGDSKGAAWPAKNSCQCSCEAWESRDTVHLQSVNSL